MYKINLLSSWFSKIVDNILYPIRLFPFIFILFLFLIWFPGIYVHSNSYINRIIYVISNITLITRFSFLFNVGLSYILLLMVVIGYKYNKYLGYIVSIAFLLVLVSLSIIQIFLYDNFGMKINSNAFQLIYETNSGESSEFISEYIIQFSNLWYLLFVILIFYVFFFAIRRQDTNYKKKYLSKIGKKHLSRLRIFLSSYLFCGILFFLYSMPLFSLNWQRNLVLSDERDRFGLIHYYVFTVYNSVLQFIDEKKEPELCAKSQVNIISTAKDKTIGSIVLVIGESYNRHHCSLYGYNKETCPFLSKINNIFVFDDVIASMNATTISFKNFMSTSSVDSKTKWYEEPLFPAIFKQSGYNVIFNSNQFVADNKSEFYDAQCGFFHHPKVKPYLFSFTNSYKYRYDGELIQEYKKIQNKIEKDSMNLIIHHLMGQHVKTNERYPGRGYFSYKDYADRPELSQVEKTKLSYYDNATRYNDSIVAQIIDMYKNDDAIVIYFADHGDEANDYRLHLGRARDFDNVEAPCLHCQLDIPFLIYTSPLFIKKHKQIYDRIKMSQHRPYMIDDLPHLLMDIGSIDTKWYTPSRSLINVHYNSKRKRIIKGYSFGDGEFDYDAVCKKYGAWTIGF